MEARGGEGACAGPVGLGGRARSGEGRCGHTGHGMEKGRGHVGGTCSQRGPAVRARRPEWRARVGARGGADHTTVVRRRRKWGGRGCGQPGRGLVCNARDDRSFSTHHGGTVCSRRARLTP